MSLQQQVAARPRSRYLAIAGILAAAVLAFGIGLLEVGAVGPLGLAVDDITANNSLTIGKERFDVRAYGAKCDGATDDTAAIQAAINAAGNTTNIATNKCGGLVQFPSGVCRVAGQLTIPNDGTLYGDMCSLRFSGVGGGASWNWPTVANTGGSVLQLEYQGTCGKLCGIANFGHWEIDHLKLISISAADTTPFIYDTLATLYVHDVSFRGVNATTAANQDAIVLGGQTQAVTDNTVNSQFAGYGTVITSNFFERIRRGVYLGTNANGIQITNNTFATQTGSNLAGGAAIELNGVAPGAVGNYIAGNLFEMSGYPYGVKVVRGNGNQIVNNSFFDAQAGTTLAYVRLDTANVFGTLVQSSSFGNSTFPLVSDNSGSTQNNTVIQTAQSQTSQIAQPWSFNGAIAFQSSTNVPTGFNAACTTAGTCNLQVSTTTGKTSTMFSDTTGNTQFNDAGNGFIFNATSGVGFTTKNGGNISYQDDGAGNHNWRNTSGVIEGALNNGYLYVANASGALASILRSNGHWTLTGQTAPTLSACGTGPSVVTGTDWRGYFTTGAATTVCTLTFGQSYGVKPSCIVTSETGTAPTYTPAAATLTLTVAVASTTYHYDCAGPTGGS